MEQGKWKMGNTVTIHDKQFKKYISSAQLLLFLTNAVFAASKDQSIKLTTEQSIMLNAGSEALKGQMAMR